MKIAIVKTIADKLRSATSQDAKQEILEYYSSESLFKRIVAYTYNPMINFNMDEWSPKHMGKEHGMGISKFMHIPEDIFQGKFTQNEAEFAANMALLHMNDNEAELFVGMLKKDINVGLTVDTINRVWPNLVPVYPVQRPKEYQPSLLAEFTFPVAAQKMSTGLRVNIVVRGNSIEFRDKNGNVLHNFHMYNEQFGNLAQNGGTVFDGHAVVVDEDMNIIATDDVDVLAADPENIRFILWDCIRYDGFVNGIDNRIGYNWRFNGLEHMMFLAVDKNPTPCYRAPEHKMVSSIEDAVAYAKQEKCPIVIKNLPGIWKNGYSTDELIIRS